MKMSVFNCKKGPAKSSLSRCSLAHGIYLFTAEIPTVRCQTKYLLQSVMNKKEKKIVSAKVPMKTSWKCCFMVRTVASK